MAKVTDEVRSAGTLAGSDERGTNGRALDAVRKQLEHPLLIGTREQDELYPGDAVPLSWKIVASLRLKNASCTLRQLGDAVGYNAQSVARWVQDARYQRYENWLLRREGPLPSVQEEALQRTSRQRVADMVEERAPEMMERLLLLVEQTGDDKLQKEIASDILAMAGFAAKRNTEERAFSVILSADVMSEFLLKAREAGLPLGVVDGELVEDR